MSLHTHIIGIGGAGMSAIAHLLLERGETVSGCDRQANAASAELAARGATVLAGHSADHLATVDRLLVTSALPADHIELAAARERGLPVLTRHDLWREWSRERPVAAISGTHGKTTTTAMTALALRTAGLNPGYLIGAQVPALGGAAAWGQGPLVIEADEYARTFLALTPQVAVITNLDWDHVDIYPTPAEYDAAFREFAVGPAGAAPRHLIMCGDDDGVRRVLADLPAVRCGLDAGNDWRALDVVPREGGMAFTVQHAGAILGAVWLGVSGEHNVRNALLALAIGDFYEVSFAVMAAALGQFRGSARRFEPKGTAGGIDVFDDYAHHPTEIRATLAAARARFPGRRIVAYFQPHTYSRLEAFQADFAASFADADVVRIGAVYAARETAAGADPTARIVGSMDHPDVAAVGDLAGAYANLCATLRPGDVLLTLGAGDGVIVGEQLLTTLQDVA